MKEIIINRITVPVTVDGHIMSIEDGNLEVDGDAISAGAPSVTISGKQVSLNGGQLVIGSYVYALQTTSFGDTSTGRLLLQLATR